MQRTIPKLFLKLVLLSALLLSQACIKDVDLDQIDEFVIPPEAAIDLVYFNLETSDFFDPNNAPIYLIEDVVKLEFLDDDYIQTSLMRAEFNFKYTNTFPQDFTNTITFLSKNNTVNHTIKFDIPAGNAASPKIIDYTEIIDEANIGTIRNSIKMKIELEMQPNSQPIQGDLQLKSKAFYKFEF